MKTEIHSHPKEADFCRCLNWQEWPWQHRNNQKCNVQHSFLFSFDHRLVGAAAFICHCMDWCLRILLSVSILFLNSSDTASVILFSDCNKDDFWILLAEQMMTALWHTVCLPLPKRFSFFSLFVTTVRQMGTADWKGVENKHMWTDQTGVLPMY